MAKKTQLKPLPKVPLLDDQQGYVAARSKLSKVCESKRKLDQEVADLLEKVKTAKPHNAVQAKAAAILNDGEPETDSLPAMRQRLSELRGELQAHEEAERLQQQAVQDSINAANLELQNEFKELYLPYVEKTREAAIALTEAVDAERRFKATLEAQGFNLRPKIDTPSRQCFAHMTTDWRGPVARYLRAVEQNYGLETPAEYLPQ